MPINMQSYEKTINIGTMTANRTISIKKTYMFTYSSGSGSDWNWGTMYYDNFRYEVNWSESRIREPT